MTDWADVLDGRATWCVVESECLTMLKTIPDSCIEALCVDPPSGIGFMNASWDKNKGGRDNWITWLTEIMREVYRVLKPGAHGFVWALPRTSHWTGMALELAGFEIRDRIAHIFGQGFSKSLNVSKSIDKMMGVDSEILRQGPELTSGGVYGEGINAGYLQRTLTIPVTDEAKQWDGYGTGLKPAVEDYWLCRKPLAAPTIAQNVLQYSTGALNIAATRVGFSGGTTRSHQAPYAESGWRTGHDVIDVPAGRWPPNLLLSHTAQCQRVGERRVKGQVPAERPMKASNGQDYGRYDTERTALYGYADPDGFEVVEEWDCHESCPVQELDRQSGVSGSQQVRITTRPRNKGWVNSSPGDGVSAIDNYGDEGCASRFFPCFDPDLPDFPFKYQSKPSQAERNKGLSTRKRRKVNDGRQTPIDNPYQRGETERVNDHATVKSLKLMSWLVSLITPPGGCVLDPFAGSGSTLIAATRLGFRAIGVEQDPHYVELARQRIAEDSPLFNRPREVTE